MIKTIISSNNYFEYLNSNNLNEEQLKEVDNFENHMMESMKYQDYLVGEHKKEFDNYSYKISSALEEVIFDEDKDKLNPLQKRAIERYTFMMEEAKKFQENKRTNEYKKVLKKEKKSGFVNAFFVVLTMLASGIIIGIALYLGM